MIYSQPVVAFVVLYLGALVAGLAVATMLGGDRSDVAFIMLGAPPPIGTIIGKRVRRHRD